MIKKILLLCTITLFLSACAHQKKAEVIYSEWHIQKRVLKENNQRPLYEISIDYPEVTNSLAPHSTKDVNNVIQTFVKNSVQPFKEKMHLDNDDLKDFPPEMRKNYLHMTYTAAIVKPHLDTIISIRSRAETLFLGQDIPKHYLAVLNYDMTHGKILTLSSLFKPDSSYLEILSDYCKEKLTKRLTSGMPWMAWNMTGLAPLPENFQYWNVQPNGLTITFDESQLSPYSTTAQTVTIPYGVLKNVLA